MRPKVYRYFSNETLLYIGASESIDARLARHKHHKKWFDTVTKITIESFHSVRAALDAEKAAIVNEKPLHNIMYNKKLLERGFIGVFELAHMLNIPPGRIKIEIQYKRFPISPSAAKPFRWTESEVKSALEDATIAYRIGALQDV